MDGWVGYDNSVSVSFFGCNFIFFLSPWNHFFFGGQDCAGNQILERVLIALWVISGANSLRVPLFLDQNKINRDAPSSNSIPFFCFVFFFSPLIEESFQSCGLMCVF